MKLALNWKRKCSRILRPRVRPCTNRLTRKQRHCVPFSPKWEHCECGCRKPATPATARSPIAASYSSACAKASRAGSPTGFLQMKKLTPRNLIGREDFETRREHRDEDV